MTASDRASLCGASTTARKSSNSTPMLWWLPPDTRQTPGAICVDRTTTGGTVASRTTSGITSSRSRSRSTCTPVTVISIELWPGLSRGSPWCECSTVGNITPSKSS